MGPHHVGPVSGLCAPTAIYIYYIIYYISVTQSCIYIYIYIYISYRIFISKDICIYVWLKASYIYIFIYIIYH
jgi:hypothetical protein